MLLSASECVCVCVGAECVMGQCLRTVNVWVGVEGVCAESVSGEGGLCVWVCVLSVCVCMNGLAAHLGGR